MGISEVVVVVLISVMVSRERMFEVITLDSAVRVMSIVVDSVVVSVKVIAGGTLAHLVAVILSELETYVPVVYIVLIDVMRSVLVTGLGKYPGQNLLQKP